MAPGSLTAEETQVVEVLLGDWRDLLRCTAIHQAMERVSIPFSHASRLRIAEFLIGDAAASDLMRWAPSIYVLTNDEKLIARRAVRLWREGARIPQPGEDEWRKSGRSGEQIEDAFEALAREVSPDIVFTHTRADRHQDHRVVSDLTWNTFRSHLILEYEVPKYDGDLGVPNLFVPLTAAAARAKIRHLRAAFGSQRSKRWFTADTFHALLRLRGVESAAPEGLAEAFYARKASMSF